MRPLLIAALREGTGKTAITVGLGLLGIDRELAVGYMKPKGTRLESRVGKVQDRDPELARELLGIDDELPDLEPIVYSPTFVQTAVRGGEDPDALRSRIEAAHEALADERDMMLIEGAGNLDLGGIVELTDPEIAALLGADVVLVAEFDRLEDLDVVLRGATAFGNRLVGILFNRVRDRAVDVLEADAIPFLERRNHPVLGVIPHDRELAGVTAGELGEQLGARRLTSGGSDAYVERFLVAATGPDAAFRQFRRTRNAAVVTGGDRAEIHAAAIEASGVTCLVVTGSLQPPRAVLERAEREGLAVLAVDTDTLAAVQRAESIVNMGRTQDAATVRTMAEYLEEAVDVDALLHRR